VDNECSEENDFHYLDQRVGRHEIGGFPEDFLVVWSDGNDKKIDSEVYNQEYHEKSPRESHNEFFG